MKNKKLFFTFTILLVLGTLALSYNLSIAKQTVVEITYTETPVLENINTPSITETSNSPDSTGLQAGMVATSKPDIKPESIISKNIANTPESSEIIKTIERAYYIEVEAARTNDLSKFPTVFINDLRFDLPLNWLKVVRKVTGNPSLEKAGFLDYKIAYFTLVHEEFLKNEAIRALHPYTPEPTSTVPPGMLLIVNNPPPPLVFESVNINNEIATVVVNEGIRTFKYILILADGRWQIAGGNIVAINP